MTSHIRWVTNEPAPYRLPVWQALSRSGNLTVSLIGGDKSLHRWSSTHGTSYELRRVAGLRKVGCAWNCATSSDVVIFGIWDRAWLLLAVSLRRRLPRRVSVAFYE